MDTEVKGVVVTALLREIDRHLARSGSQPVLCSVVKHAGSGRARKKCRGKHETKSSVFPHFLSALPLPKCFTTEQSIVEASLFVL